MSSNIMIKNISKLRDRLITNKYVDHTVGKEFTIIGVTKSGLALIQYEDGSTGDELSLPEIINENKANDLGVSHHGIDDKNYEQISGSGPSLDESCSEEDHEWVLTDEHSSSHIYHGYLKNVKCKKCNLSGESLLKFKGCDVPVLCEKCNGFSAPEDSVIDDMESYCEKCVN